MDHQIDWKDMQVSFESRGQQSARFGCCHVSYLGYWPLAIGQPFANHVFKLTSALRRLATVRQNLGLREIAVTSPPEGSISNRVSLRGSNGSKIGFDVDHCTIVLFPWRVTDQKRRADGGSKVD